MIIPQKYRLKNTIKYPTTIIIGGLNKLGLEVASALIEQGGYVIIIDALTPGLIEKYDIFPTGTMISFLDYTSILHLDEDVRRVDYVFYFAYEFLSIEKEISTQDFLTFSNYLDAVLSLTTKYEARFLLATSIKGHQLLNSDKVLLDYSKTEFDQHKVYSEIELQKYAEGLTIEYFKKVNLNIRIVRLGEIIGDGLDLLKKTAFNTLILEAVQAKPLVLKNDGLEQEWFVHVLDCSYGLIKAQFGKQTMGNIYSIAYENTFSHISVAYKIQELEENAKEIRFEGTHHGLPSLILKKPAANLSKIGWMPRVSFDRAVQQSLALAKLYFVEDSVKNRVDGTNTSSNLQAFKNIANGSGGQQKKELVRERVRITNAERLKKQKVLRERSFSKKIQDGFWKIFTNLSNAFSFFRNKSPLEVSLLILGFGIFVALYIFIISPLLVLFRNIIVIVPEYANSKTNFENLEYSEFSSNINSMASSVGQLKELVESTNSISSFLLVDSEQKVLLDTLNAYDLYLSGMQDINKSLSNIDMFYDKFENNTQIRSGSLSLLSTIVPAKNLEADLQQVQNNSAFLDAGLQKIQKSNELLNSISYSVLPAAMQTSMANIRTDIQSLDVEAKVSQIKYLPDLLGLGNQRNILVVLLDNSRPMPLGGDMSAYALVTLSNGGIQQIEVKDFKESDFANIQIDSVDLDRLNVSRFRKESIGNVQIHDLASISSIKEFTEVISNVFEDKKGIRPDLVVTMNLEGLPLFMDLIPNTNPIIISNSEIKKDSLLPTLNATQQNNPNVQNRREAIAQIFAQTLFYSIESINKNPSGLSAAIEESVSQSNIKMYSENLAYRDYLETYDVSQTRSLDSDTFLYVSLLQDDPRIVQQTVFPDTTVSVVAEIDQVYNLRNVITISLPTNLDLREVSLCFSLEVPFSDIQVDGVPQTSYSISSSDSVRCIAASVVQESNIRFIFTQLGLTNSSVSNPSIEFGLMPVFGSKTILDYSFDLSSLLKVSPRSTVPNIVNNSLSGFREFLNFPKQYILEFE